MADTSTVVVVTSIVSGALGAIAMAVKVGVRQGEIERNLSAVMKLVGLGDVDSVFLRADLARKDFDSLNTKVDTLTTEWRAEREAAASERASIGHDLQEIRLILARMGKE